MTPVYKSAAVPPRVKRIGFLRLLFASMVFSSHVFGLAGCAVIALTCALNVCLVAAFWVLPLVLLWLARVLPFSNFAGLVGGDYRFGLYVHGYPCQQMLAHFRVHQLGFGVYLAASLILAGGCAVCCWHRVEGPALRLKDCLVHRPLRVLPA